MFSDYYARAFPYETVHRLFAREWQAGPGADKREYGIETHPDGQFRRWKACPRPQDLHAFVQHPKFGKLNVGAMFDKCPLERWRCKSGSEPKAVQREFVIDIDMDDYDSMGISKDSIHDCDAAWPLVAVGLQVCKTVLKETFGFAHILPVYSGRRGGHLWVMDKRACLLNDAARKSIVDFLKPGQRTHASGRKTFKWLLMYPTFGSPENPMQREGVFSRIVYAFFRDTGVKPRDRGGLGLLDTGFDREAFLRMIDDRFADELMVSARSASNGISALKIIEAAVMNKPDSIKEWIAPRFCEAICTLVWPRVDEAVSTHMNHTLKAPFSVHPKTGRVSMPIRALFSFDPAIDAPLAAAEMPPSFYSVVERTNAFIDALAQSDTEQWQPPDLSVLEPPPKRKCFNLKTGAASDDTPVLADHDRVCWVCTRSLSLYVDDEGLVHFEMRTRCYDRPATRVIPAGQFPPFPHQRKMGQAKLDSMLNDVLSTIAHANLYRNTDWSAFTWHTIFIVVPRQATEIEAARKEASARLERMRERLEEGVSVGQARESWGEMAICSYIRQELWPLVQELRTL